MSTNVSQSEDCIDTLLGVDIPRTEEGTADVLDAFQTLTNTIDELDDGIATSQQRGAATDEFLVVLALGLEEGDVKETTKDEFVASVVNSQDSLTKGAVRADLKSIRETVAEEVKDEEVEASEIVSPDALVDPDRELLSLYRRITNDSDEATVLEWHWEAFDGSEVVVTTESEHNSLYHFQNVFSGATGRPVGKPDFDQSPPSVSKSEDWHLWMSHMVNDYFSDHPNHVRKYEGPRSEAISDLRSDLGRATPTIDREKANASSCPYIGEEVPNDEVWIPTSLVQMVLTQHESVSAKALQVELDAQSTTRGGSIRVAGNKTLAVEDGSTARFWRLDREWAGIEAPDGEGEDAGGDDE